MPGLQITDYRLHIRSVVIKIFLFSVLCFLFSVNGYAEEKKDEPIIVNGDTVEYSTTGKEVTATGNVSVINKGAKLTCHKLTVNTQTKDAEAEGNVRLEDAKGVIEGQKMKYNFQTKSGTIIDSAFRANPYFGRAEKVDKVSESEFIARRGFMTTCNYDEPHYRIKSRKMDIFPDDKVQTKDDTFYMGRIPLLYAPQYNHSLKDPLMHVQLMPGKSKDWGAYMLSAWRYNITEDVKGRIYFDYRASKGVAEGFGTNYATSNFGKGDFKYYYTQERDKSKNLGDEEAYIPRKFERYLIRWRHQWNIDEKTNLTSEYYKITDSKRILYPNGNYNFLKDYFFREYEKDAQPLSYVLVHHSFNYSSMDFLMQKRINRWQEMTEKLPEIKYSLPSLQIGETPFYFANDSSYLNYNYKYSVPAPAADDTSTRRDVTANRFDTTDRLSLPTKIAFINLTPFISGQDSYSDKSTYGATSTIVFSTGSDASTKFYRLFNIQSNFLGLDINNLRHIITPSIAYSYSKTSLMPSGKARFGGGATTAGGSSASLGLSNKLQTKRNNQSVDFLDFNVSSSYAFKPKTGDKRGSSLSDFLFTLKLLPYSWMSINSDATYVHSGARDSANYNHFSNANYDFNINLGSERSFGIGQRYQLKGGNEITPNLIWRLNPKWKFSVYQRYYRGHETTRARGLREQEYSISRDLHCWTWDITYNIKRGYGESIWFVFTLKAFPELEFNFNESYHAPKPGSQSPELVR